MIDVEREWAGYIGQALERFLLPKLLNQGAPESPLRVCMYSLLTRQDHHVEFDDRVYERSSNPNTAIQVNLQRTKVP